MPNPDNNDAQFAAFVKTTGALPDIPNGARPLVYEQVIPDASSAADAAAGKPDPAHDD